ncbi:MAG: glycosidase, partial [Candidatus Heimdallarchaeota archaeon]
LAEVYWDLGFRLQQLGFDYTYDKRLYDRLYSNSPQSVQGHLGADLDYQKRSLRFIENHDEKRALSLGKEKSKVAAVICGSIPGLTLYHQGQLEGYQIKIPVQLKRKKNESIDNELESFYNKLLSFTNQQVFRHGQWYMLNISEAWNGNNSCENLLAWQWNILERKQSSLIVVNYSSVQSQGRIFLVLDKKWDNVKTLEFEDVIDGKNYKRDRIETSQNGLFVDLEPYQCHLFNLKN